MAEFDGIVMEALADEAVESDLGDEELNDLAAPAWMQRYGKAWGRGGHRAVKATIKRAVQSMWSEKGAILYGTIPITIGTGPVFVASLSDPFANKVNQSPAGWPPGVTYDSRFSNMSAAGQIPASTSYLVKAFGVLMTFLAPPAGGGLTQQGVITDFQQMGAYFGLSLKWAQDALDDWGLLGMHASVPHPVPNGAVGLDGSGVFQVLAGVLQDGTWDRLTHLKPGVRLRTNDNLAMPIAQGAAPASNPAGTVYGLIGVLKCIKRTKVSAQAR